MADLIGPFTTKYDGKCNVCRQPYSKGERIQQDPGKPTWYSEKAQKEQKNYAHVSCVESGVRNLQRDEPVKPYSFAPNANGESPYELMRQGLILQLKAIDALILSESDPAHQYDSQLDGEIPY